MKYFTRLTLVLLVTLAVSQAFYVLPTLAAGDASSTSLIVCDGGKGDECGFNDLIELANNAFNFAVYKVGLPIGGILILIAGFQFMTSKGNAGEITKAKNKLFNILIGLAVMLTAWIIVKTILTWLGCTDCLSLIA